VSYLVDTCVIAEVVRTKPAPAVVSWLAAQDEDRLFVSVLTLGELHKGIARLADSPRRRTLEAWVGGDLHRRFSGRIIPVDADIAARWGRISGDAERAGRVIPVIDGLLAATALENGLTLVTRDVSHFEPAGVELLNPWHEAAQG
jgi:predicted nucleic acid-binding protein